MLLRMQEGKNNHILRIPQYKTFLTMDTYEPYMNKKAQNH
jgi:hypothetical protein